jgi:hypothetical protein
MKKYPKRTTNNSILHKKDNKKEEIEDDDWIDRSFHSWTVEKETDINLPDKDIVFDEIEENHESI